MDRNVFEPETGGRGVSPGIVSIGIDTHHGDSDNLSTIVVDIDHPEVDTGRYQENKGWTNSNHRVFEYEIESD